MCADCNRAGPFSYILFFLFSPIFCRFQKQCQIGVLPLGTGNDLARVIGWGSVCDDDAHLPQLLERYEKASVKMLDRYAAPSHPLAHPFISLFRLCARRWSIFTSERSMPLPRKVVLPYEPITAFEDSIVNHLGKILQSDEHTIVISSAKSVVASVFSFFCFFSANNFVFLKNPVRDNQRVYRQNGQPARG